MREDRNVSLNAEVEAAYNKAAKLTWTQSQRLDFLRMLDGVNMNLLGMVSAKLVKQVMGIKRKLAQPQASPNHPQPAPGLSVLYVA